MPPRHVNSYQAYAAPQQQTAALMRPVPVGAPIPEPSEWSPVQRVRNDAVPGAPSGVSQAVTIERPQMVAYAPGGSIAGEPPLLSSPASTMVTLPEPSSLGGGKAKDSDKDAPKASNTLPLPRPSKPVTYPEIPAPMITHPPHAPREFQKHALSSYVIEPPDVLQIETSPTFGDPAQVLAGPHLVRPDGSIGLGSSGSVFVAGMTIEQAKFRIVEKIRDRGLENYDSLPSNADVPRIMEQRKKQAEAEMREIDKTPIRTKEIAAERFSVANIWNNLKVDVAAFNSKYYFVITDGGGYGETVVRVPCTGNETILDAISQIQGLPVVASKHRIWLARATPHDHDHPLILPVDWNGIVRRGSGATNYQVFPGDRIYVNSSKLIRVDSGLAKILSPIERLFGITLLGATTVNAINGQQF